VTTSGSSDFTETFRQIATSALVMVGACAMGDTPAEEDMDTAKTQANLMLKTWGADPKPKLWQMSEGSVTPLASTASYALAAARKVLSARRRTGTGVSQNDTPMTMISRQEYFDKANKLSIGYATEAYFDPQRAARTLYVWPVPNATIAAAVTIPYTYLRVIEDIDALDDDFDTPQEWLEVLQYGLAARLTPFFKNHIADPQGAAKIEERAAFLYGQLSAYDDEETSVFMQPEMS
jgi:hypothetical protein